MRIIWTPVEERKNLSSVDERPGPPGDYFHTERTMEKKENSINKTKSQVSREKPAEGELKGTIYTKRNDVCPVREYQKKATHY